MSQEKKHTTVQLTLERIQRARPCAPGLRAAQMLLPVKISTDPEKNIELALDWLQLNEHLSHGHPSWAAMDARLWAHWAMLHIVPGANCDDYPDLPSEYLQPNTVGLVAQWLAWMADAIATEEGR